MVMRATIPAARWAELALLFAATLLYLWTLDNGLQPYELLGGDLITHHYAQVQARFANAPGYPLYSMGGWLWYQMLYGLNTTFGISQPNPIPILSSYSTLWAIPALWLFYRLLLRYTTTAQRPHGNWPVAWLLAAFFGVTYFFWYYATTSEQYSSAVAQTLAILYVYHIWADKTQAQSNAGISTHAISAETRPIGANRWLYLLAFLCGISLAHMLTVAFIVPPLVVVVLHQASNLLRSVRVIAGAVLAAALPLLSYIFVYVRGAQYPEWRGAGEWESHTEWFWQFLATDQGRDELSWGLEPGAPFFGGGFPAIMWQELSIPLLLLGLVGIAFLPRRTLFILYGTLALYLGFCWAYRLGNWFQVIIPAYPLILFGVAVLITRLETWSRPMWPLASIHLPGGTSPRHAAVILALILALIWRVQGSLPDANSRNRPEDTGLDRAAALLDQPLPANAALFASVEDAQALQYLSQIWKIRPDVSLTGSDRAGSILATGTPLLVTWDAASLLLTEISAPSALALHALSPDWYWLLPSDSIQSSAQVSTTAAAFPGSEPSVMPLYLPTDEPMQVVQHTLHDGIILYGYHAHRAPTGAPVQQNGATGLDLTLYWELQTTHNDLAWGEGLAWGEDLGISIRPLRGQGYMESHAESESGTPETEAFIKTDRAKPAPLLLTGSSVPLLPHPAMFDAHSTIADPYRFHLTPEQLARFTGFELILYRALEGGEFENIAVERFPLEIAVEMQAIP